MRLTGFTHPALLSIAILALAVPATTLAQRETETVDRTLPFPSGGTLALHNFSGDVHITGTTGRDIVIKAVRRADRDRLDHIKLDIQASGSRVMIEANTRDDSWHDRDNNVVDTTFEIQIPASARLDIDAFSSDLDIRGITGEQRLKTFSGDITIDAAAAGTAPDLSAETFSGGIRARLADEAKGDVQFSTFSGNLDSDLPLTIRSTSRSRTLGSLPGGSGGGSLTFKTFSGNVRVTK